MTRRVNRPSILQAKCIMRCALRAPKFGWTSLLAQVLAWGKGQLTNYFSSGVRVGVWARAAPESGCACKAPWVGVCTAD
jgi:hypothetical protein